MPSVDDRDDTDRITRDEIEALYNAHKEQVSFNKDLLNKFLDREAFDLYMLLPPQEQSTIMTAHSLQKAESEGNDTVEVADFAGWVVRGVAERILRCTELSPKKGAVEKLTKKLEKLRLVDSRMVERGLMIGRAKALFEITDANGGGTISRAEMQKMLRRFKVPLTKSEFNVLWRTDQTPPTTRLPAVSLPVPTR